MEERTIQELLLESFENTSKLATAIKKGDRVVSYEECFKTASRIQSNLTEITNGETKIFCVVILSEPEKVILTALGIIFTSLVFVPIDPKTPEYRVKQMLSSIDRGIVIYDDSELLSAFGESWRPVSYSELVDDENGASKDNFIKDLGMSHPDDLLYIYFTSGTTGRPNAVAGRNKSLAHFISWEIKELNVGEAVRTSQLTDFGHDPFLRDIFLPLCSGGEVHIPLDKQTILDGVRLSEWLVESRIQIVHCTPGIFHILCKQELKKFPDLQCILLAGATPSVNDIRKWFDCVGDSSRIYNLYGPTETTLAKMFHLITPEDVKSGVIPIGRPISDTSVHLIIDEDAASEDSQVGEIVICSPYSSLGYFNNEELTKLKFSNDSTSNDTQTVTYKTGDLGKMLPSGNLLFIGRKDRQFKIRGYRIEPEEIENSILEIEGVSQCVVIYFPKDEEGIDGSIVAYLEPEYINIESVRRKLEKELPHHMLPSQYVTTSSLKLNERGKVDFTALIDPRAIMTVDSQMAKNKTEEILYNIWVNLLGIKGFSRDGHFFQLGGSSLNVMSLVYEIYQEMDIDVSLEEVFTYPVFSDMASYIAGKLETEDKISEENKDKLPQDDKPNQIHELSLTYDFLQTGGIPDVKVLVNIEPFNTLFYRSCFYNAFFTVVKYHQREITSFLCNDIALYDYRNNGAFGISYLSMNEHSVLLKEQGLEITRLEKKEQFYESIFHSIASNIPVIIGVDCYYEPNRTDMYQINHWYHYVNIIGYDLKQRLFYILEHDHADSLDYYKMSISFEDLETCYTKGLLLLNSNSLNNHFFTLSKRAGYKEATTCYQDYISYVHFNKNRLIESSNKVILIVERCDEIMRSFDRFCNEGEMLIRNIREVYQAKTALVYLLERFLDEKHPCLRHLYTIVEIWKMALLSCTEAKIRKKLIAGRWERVYKRMQTLEHEEREFIQKWIGGSHEDR
ncbi:AMP-binding protein [Paenibacillus aquistagni]|uniref:AMP-binding protein n=1 Tax=Paenibacillus aquistagni TaxID=1852522 RepID=UPI000B4FE224|nr:AMP-binding protein [Paenibacillus aquistagni]